MKTDQNTLNPFVLQPYVSKDLFCDRKVELNGMLSHISNGANITLISMRRLGKTGLIFRCFEELKALGYKTFYADVYATSSLDDFVRTLAEAVFRNEKQSVAKKFFNTLGGIRPLISYDAISGQPQLSITYQSETQKQTTLKSILDYLESLESRVVVAIDEFQQIREYENVRMEALLRGYIQNLKNVRFIFCGSHKKLMTEIFTAEKSPFYQSTVNIPLHKLDREVYAQFIKDKFNAGGKDISDDAIDFIMNWSRCHTFYTQTLCHYIYILSGDFVSMENVYTAIEAIFDSETDRFYTIRNMLTKGQWKYLAAVAKEQVVKQPTSSTFLEKYKLGAASSAKRYLDALVEKELILESITMEGNEYSVYNVFLSRWLERY